MPYCRMLLACPHTLHPIGVPRPAGAEGVDAARHQDAGVGEVLVAGNALARGYLRRAARPCTRHRVPVSTLLYG